jgi:glycolate oxidase FAD binding subunit
MLAEASSTRWELDALEASPDESAVYARLGGPAAALEVLAKEILQRWPGQLLSPADADAVWESTAAFRWAHPSGDSLFKIPLTLSQLPAFAAAVRELPSAKAWLGAGGNVAFLSLPSAAETRVIGEKLRALNLSALTLRGAAPLWLGARPDFNLYRAVKTALDPQNRFPSLND